MTLPGCTSTSPAPHGWKKTKAGSPKARRESACAAWLSLSGVLRTENNNSWLCSLLALSCGKALHAETHIKASTLEEDGLQLTSSPQICFQQVPFGGKLRIFFGPLEAFSSVSQQYDQQQCK